MKISVRALKRQARDLIKRDRPAALKITFIPALVFSLCAILLFSFLGFMIIYLRYQGISISQEFLSIAASGESGYSGFNISGMIRSVITNIVLFILYAGVRFTFLDWLRDPEHSPKHPFKAAFQGFTAQYVGALLLLGLLVTVFTFLWGLLVIIPGIIMGYAYRQTAFLYKDQAQHTIGYLARITASKALMKGHKGQLFVLDLSFIGWFLLSVLTAGIALFWVLPYYHATNAAFYEAIHTSNVEEQPS